MSEAPNLIANEDRPDLLALVQDLQAEVELLRREASSQKSRNARLLMHLQVLDQRLAALENSRILSGWKGVATSISQLHARAGQALLRSPLHRFWRAFPRQIAPASDSSFERFVAREQSALPPKAEQEATGASWSYRPTISLIIPVFRPRREWLTEALESVERQSYLNWEICVCVDGKPEQWVIQLLERWSGRAPVRYAVLSERRGISAASNAAARLARGDYLAFLDHDDVLADSALYFLAEALQLQRADLLYTDEDHLDVSGVRVRPRLKPDWSNYLLHNCMYLGHLLVVRRSLFEQVWGFRSEYDGAQDFDLVLRLIEARPKIGHIPRLLYHWRLHPGSTSAEDGNAKPYAHEAGRRALEDALVRQNAKAQVRDGARPFTYCVQPVGTSTKELSVVICSRNSKLLERCLRTLEATRFSSMCEYVVIHHHQAPSVDQDMERVLDKYNCKVVRYQGSFNFALMSNLGAEQSIHPLLLFANDDIYAEDGSDWSETLPWLLDDERVGVVGATLLYPTGSIQHAGIVAGLGEGVGHSGRLQFASDLWPWLQLTRNVTAVTGAFLGIRSSVFRELGGFDIDFPSNYNDVDLCLRARASGYEVLCAGIRGLVHEECQTRTGGTSLIERERFYEKWPQVISERDRFYSPSLADTEQIALRMS